MHQPIRESESGPRFALAVLILSIVMLGSACSPDAPAAWYPTGEATVVSWFEVEVDAMRSCTVTVAISNRGTAEIATSTVSLAVETDLRAYYRTLVSDTRILPGGTIYLTGALPYASIAERAADNGIDVVAQFYE